MIEVEILVLDLFDVFAVTVVDTIEIIVINFSLVGCYGYVYKHCFDRKIAVGFSLQTSFPLASGYLE